MHSLRVFLNERLAAAAEEILGAVEKTIFEYKEEICRSKDLEISRLRMQLKLLKAEARLEKSLAAQERSLHQSSPPPPPEQRHHPSFPAAEAGGHGEEEEEEAEEAEEEEESSICVEPRTSPVKTEETSHGDFWMEHDDHLDHLGPDIKDFMTSAPGLRAAGLQDPAVSFHHGYGDGGNGLEEGAKDRPYCCSVCEKRFSNSSHLAAHIRTHTGERPYRCDICRKTFITTSALNRHQTIHSEGKRFICNYCGKTFKWMESLGRHIRSVHKRDNQQE